MQLQIFKGKRNKQEREKFDKEWRMAKTLAENNLVVEYRDSIEGSFDAFVDGEPTDFKQLLSATNIVKRAMYALKQQGAKRVAISIKAKSTPLIIEKIAEIRRKGVKGWYWFEDSSDVINEI